MSESQRFKAGRRLARREHGEEIVIAGISGKFPKSDNVEEFKENLMNKVDMCDDDERRWKHNNPEVPKFSGKINQPEKFDPGFFGVHRTQAEEMDPIIRMSLESAYEAFADAGISPEDIKGSRTGVFIASYVSEAEYANCYGKVKSQGYSLIGCMKSMIPQRISYALQLNGPTMVCDAACSSSLHALTQAYKSICEGKCDMAIAGGANLCFNLNTTLQHMRFGVLNMNTGCRPFDEKANGYTRSEAIVMILLQKKKVAKRIYAEVVYCKSNVDGYKEKGMLQPSGDGFTSLFKDIYEEANISPLSVGLIEAHSAGTVIGDPIEVKRINDFFSPGRKNALLIGSCKSNAGHTEAASGFCSTIKLIYAMYTGIIPPNINFDKPNKKIKGLLDSSIKVVTEKTPWPKNFNFAAVNNFGFGGANCHVLLKRPNNNNIIRPVEEQTTLVCYSGRTIESMKSYSNFLKSKNSDYESTALIHSFFKKRIENDDYRGFSLIDSSGELYNSYKYIQEEPKELHLLLNGVKPHHVEILEQMQKLNFFRDSINEFKLALKRNNVSEDFDKPNVVFGTICLHYCLIKILKLLNAPICKITCSSIGQLTAAYAAEVLSLDNLISIGKDLIGKSNGAAISLLKEFREVKLQNELSNHRLSKTKSDNFEYVNNKYLVNNIVNYSVDEWNNKEIIIGVDFEAVEGSLQIVHMIHKDTTLNDILIKFGELYELGMDCDLGKLYPIEWPVKRGTAMISPLIKWKHDQDFRTPTFDVVENKDAEKQVILNTSDDDFSFYKEHVVDGRHIFPGTGYLFAIWELFASTKDKFLQDMKICFEDVRFHTASTIPKDEKINLYLVIQKSGFFEVSQRNTTLVTGKIFEVENCDIAYVGGMIDPYLPVLTKKDIYTELTLRGYNYKNQFKALQKVIGNKAFIEWTGNWVTFLDNIMQFFVFQKDTRNLYVPIGFGKLVIDAKGHMEQVNELGEENTIPAEINFNIVRTKNVEVTTMYDMILLKKKSEKDIILETYKFVPNESNLSLEDALRVNMQIILENKPMVKINILEVFDVKSSKLQPVAKHVQQILNETPRVRASMTIHTTKNITNVSGVQITDIKPDEQSAFIYIGYNLLNNLERMQNALACIINDGFIISIDKVDISPKKYLSILTKYTLPSGLFIHLLRRTKQYQEPICIEVNDDYDSWLPKVQRDLKSSRNVLLYNDTDPTLGILGMVKCLKCEDCAQNVSCIFIQEGRKFEERSDFFRQQLQKGLAFNVLRGNTWGTYRHLLLKHAEKLDFQKCDHYYANVLNIGDLSTWSWLQGSIKSQQILNNNNFVEIYYSAINYRDILTASGKIRVDSVTRNRTNQENIHGIEYSGKKLDGKRVMSFVIGGAISNLIESDPLLTWNVPNGWSLEDAATVPVVYATVILALKCRGNVKKGQSVLIHSGSGGVGLAAINCAHHWGCEIFVTVGTNEKKQFLLDQYPFLKESQIGNSRNTSFEQMVMAKTAGRGVDLVLNSLAEEKLEASVRCLAQGGCFLEIGKFDLARNSSLAMDLLSKGCTFHGVMLDAVFRDTDKMKRYVHNLMQEAINDGYVKPLVRTVFEKSSLVEPFKYMSTGNHIGKVLIKIKEEIPSPDKNEEYKIVVPRFYCEPTGSYILLGGLGGFGLELADWLVLHGAKTLIISSRTGVKTGYQQNRIKIWESYGVKVLIALENISNYDDCKNLMTKAEAIAPVYGIFNLAGVLKDGMFENQTAESFRISMSAKGLSTKHLDKITRSSKTLKHFVVFSSLACGKGNMGQTNYGMANSSMERICELRRRDGFPGLAIQWGLIADVGMATLLKKNLEELVICGTTEQRISSCLEVLNELLIQNEPVVTSFVLAEKENEESAQSLITDVFKIIGLRDLKTISPNSTLAELGLDSMMVVEIRQLLEQNYDIFLKANEIRNLTYTKLMETTTKGI